MTLLFKGGKNYNRLYHQNERLTESIGGMKIYLITTQCDA